MDEILTALSDADGIVLLNAGTSQSNERLHERCSITRTSVT